MALSPRSGWIWQEEGPQLAVTWCAAPWLITRLAISLFCALCLSAACCVRLGSFLSASPRSLQYQPGSVSGVSQVNNRTKLETRQSTISCFFGFSVATAFAGAALLHFLPKRMNRSASLGASVENFGNLHSLYVWLALCAWFCNWQSSKVCV